MLHAHQIDEQHRGLVAAFTQILSTGLDQIEDLSLGLFGGVAGHFFQQLDLRLTQFFGLGDLGFLLLDAFGELFLFFIEVFELAVNSFFLLRQTSGTIFFNSERKNRQ